MIMKIKDIIACLDQATRPELQEDYDNSGFQVGDPETECTGALIALDLTPSVIEEAKRKNLNLIVTHHPFLFRGVKRITPQDATGDMIFSLIRNGISAYAAHTNLDNLADGVNGILSQKLGLTDCHILRPLAADPATGAGMTGMLPAPMAANEFLNSVKRTLGIPSLRVGALHANTVQRVALCGGSGSFLIEDAISAHADIYLTGDLKYHDFQQAEHRITLADIGHFESEQYTKELIYSIISRNFINFACQISDTDHGYVRYI